MMKLLVKCFIRCVKYTLIAIPFSVIFLLLVVMLIQLGSQTPGVRGRPGSANWGGRERKPRTVNPPKESLEVTLERTGACENQTLLHMNARNQSIVTFCSKFNADRVSYFRRRDAKVNPYIHNFTIRGDRICDHDTDIIMLIHSLHTYGDRRAAIRNTWGTAAQQGNWPGRRLPLKVKIAFIFGTHADEDLNVLIRQESEDYQDIIQGTFTENYNNMTLKSLLGLKFVSEHCPNAKYLLKSDDDMVINFPHLEDILLQLNLHRSIMGPLCVGSKVYRKGKWGLTKELYPFNFYPPYEAGSAYIITADLIKELYETAEYVPHIFIDDVYITGILGHILNVQHIKQDGFAFWTTKVPKADDLINNKIVTGTKIKPAIQLSLWHDLKNKFNEKR